MTGIRVWWAATAVAFVTTLGGMAQAPLPRTPSPPTSRGLPPERRAPRMGFGTGGPNVIPPEGTTTTPTSPGRPVKAAPRAPAPRASAVLGLTRNLEAGTPLRVRHAIWGLTSPQGCFADLTGDGANDFVAVDARKAGTYVVVYRKRGDGWRSGETRVDALGGSEPLPPWVLPGAGGVPPSIVVPCARSPYLYLIPTDGDGTPLVAAGRSLQRYLPAVPGREARHVVERVEPASAAAPAARIHGRLVGREAEGEVTARSWTIFLEAARTWAEVAAVVPAGEESLAAALSHPVPAIWEDFDADGNRDVLAAFAGDAPGESSRLAYGAGRGDATECRTLAVLPAEDAAVWVGPALRLTPVREGEQTLYCIFFAPWQVGLFVTSRR